MRKMLFFLSFVLLALPAIVVAQETVRLAEGKETNLADPVVGDSLLPVGGEHSSGFPESPRASSPEQPGEKENTPFTPVDCMPEFPGGQEALIRFIADNIRYPEEAQKEKIEGLVVAQVTINHDGSPVDREVVGSVHPALDKEAMRILSMLPKWTPCGARNRPVRVRYTIPVRFQLPADEKEDIQAEAKEDESGNFPE